jgi:hypothetical protein
MPRGRQRRSRTGIRSTRDSDHEGSDLDRAPSSDVPQSQREVKRKKRTFQRLTGRLRQPSQVDVSAVGEPDQQDQLGDSPVPSPPSPFQLESNNDDDDEYGARLRGHWRSANDDEDAEADMYEQMMMAQFSSLEQRSGKASLNVFADEFADDGGGRDELSPEPRERRNTKKRNRDQLSSFSAGEGSGANPPAEALKQEEEESASRSQDEYGLDGGRSDGDDNDGSDLADSLLSPPKRPKRNTTTKPLIVKKKRVTKPKAVTVRYMPLGEVLRGLQLMLRISLFDSTKEETGRMLR